MIENSALKADLWVFCPLDIVMIVWEYRQHSLIYGAGVAAPEHFTSGLVSTKIEIHCGSTRSSAASALGRI